MGATVLYVGIGSLAIIGLAALIVSLNRWLKEWDYDD